MKKKLNEISKCIDGSNEQLSLLVEYLETIYSEVEYHEHRRMIDKVDRIIRWNEHIKSLVGNLIDTPKK